MSVQALSPFSGSKRLFTENPEDTDSPCDRGGQKRGRFAGSPSGRCGGPAPVFQAPHTATLNALKALFPGMDDQVGAGGRAWAGARAPGAGACVESGRRRCWRVLARAPALARGARPCGSQGACSAACVDARLAATRTLPPRPRRPLRPSRPCSPSAATTSTRPSAA